MFGEVKKFLFLKKKTNIKILRISTYISYSNSAVWLTVSVNHYEYLFGECNKRPLENFFPTLNWDLVQQ